jgi:hypothetical protein
MFTLTRLRAFVGARERDNLTKFTRKLLGHIGAAWHSSAPVGQWNVWFGWKVEASSCMLPGDF